uniref:Uncharacterized protein n=1 Tax=Arundo donax TaxID=35708 RepID=A0A0A9HM99_ARUDO
MICIKSASISTPRCSLLFFGICCRLSFSASSACFRYR